MRINALFLAAKEKFRTCEIGDGSWEILSAAPTIIHCVNFVRGRYTVAKCLRTIIEIGDVVGRERKA